VHRFVNVNVTTVRIPIERNVTIIRGTRNVTSFQVVGGTVRSTAIPVTHVERATHTRIQRADISVARTTPTRIEAGGGRQGERIRDAGPRERNVARLEEKSNQLSREGQGRRPDVSSPRPGKDRGSPEAHVVAPPERKAGRVEQKAKQNESPAESARTALRRPEKDRGSPEARVVVPPERKAGRVEQKAKQNESPAESARTALRRPEKDRGSPEARVVAPPERKAVRVEDKSKQHEKSSEPQRVASRQPPTQEQKHSQNGKDKGEKSQEHRKELPPS
jgi:hypothetical protein